jgi:hypothetical protein
MKLEELDKEIVDLISKRMEIRFKNSQIEFDFSTVVDYATEKGLDTGKIKEVFELLERMFRDRYDEMRGKGGIP